MRIPSAYKVPSRDDVVNNTHPALTQYRSSTDRVVGGGSREGSSGKDFSVMTCKVKMSCLAVSYCSIIPFSEQPRPSTLLSNERLYLLGWWITRSLLAIREGDVLISHPRRYEPS